VQPSLRLHRLLERQIRAAARGRADGTPDVQVLLGLVSEAYAEQEAHRRLDNDAFELVSREVSELNRQLREEAAARSREAARMNALLESASEAIVSADGEGVIVSFNHAAERMFGWTSEEAAGRPSSILFADWPAASQAIREALRGTDPKRARIELELPGVRKNGEVFAREFSLSILEFEGEIYRLGFHRDISGRKAGEAALLGAKEAAEAANRAKSEFLAAMSHETPTPLSGVRGLAAAGPPTPLSDEQRRMLGVIDESGQVLMTLLSDILDLSKIEAGRMVFESTPFDAAASAQAVASLYAGTAAAKGLGYEVRVGGAARGWFVGDPTRYRQVLQNLVSNALKFTESGQVTVELDAGPAPDGRVALRTSVADTGVGVSAEARERLFQKFSQADASTTRRYGGTGLGLSICKQMVEALGGEIGVDSEPGRGARFWYVLPMPRAEAPQPVLPAPAPAGARPSGLRILAADDNRANQLVLKALLAQAEAEVAFAENGAEAVQAVAGQDFDLVLMDVQMPVMDGMAAARAIRALEGPRSRVPIVAVTADAMAEQVAACAAAGMDAHVSKPLRPEELFAVIAQVLGGNAEPAAGQPRRSRSR
jgi:PAS domain S-box-containing protein